MISCLSTWKCWCFSWQTVFGTAAKTMVVDRKNQKALALLYLASKPLRTQAVCPPSLQQNRQQRWSPIKGKFELLAWTFSPKLNFSPSTKKTTAYSFELLIQLIELFFTFVVFARFATTRATIWLPIWFRAKNTGYSTRLSPHIGDPVVRTDRRTITWLLRHNQNFLAW